MPSPRSALLSILSILALYLDLTLAKSTTVASPCGTNQNPYCGNDKHFAGLCCPYPNVCYFEDRSGTPGCCPAGSVCRDGGTSAGEPAVTPTNAATSVATVQVISTLPVTSAIVPVAVQNTNTVTAIVTAAPAVSQSTAGQTVTVVSNVVTTEGSQTATSLIAAVPTTTISTPVTVQGAFQTEGGLLVGNAQPIAKMIVTVPFIVASAFIIWYIT